MAHILIVDDDQVLHRVLDALLRKEGHTVVSAENGYAGLEKLSREVFHLIISDANMPGGLSGFSLVAMIKQDKTLAHIPVIFLTGRSQKEDVVKARQSGVSDYIIKPVNHATLLRKVTAFTTPKESSRVFQTGEVAALAQADFQFRIFDVTKTELEFMSPIALPTNFEFKLQSELFVNMGIPAPLLKVRRCQPFKQNEEAFRISAQLMEMKIADLDRLEDWLDGEAVLASTKAVG